MLAPASGFLPGSAWPTSVTLLTTLCGSLVVIMTGCPGAGRDERVALARVDAGVAARVGLGVAGLVRDVDGPLGWAFGGMMSTLCRLRVEG
jgi:hypothetical protein